MALHQYIVPAVLGFHSLLLGSAVVATHVSPQGMTMHMSDRPNQDPVFVLFLAPLQAVMAALMCKTAWDSRQFSQTTFSLNKGPLRSQIQFMLYTFAALEIAMTLTRFLVHLHRGRSPWWTLPRSGPVSYTGVLISGIFSVVYLTLGMLY